MATEQEERARWAWAILDNDTETVVTLVEFSDYNEVGLRFRCESQIIWNLSVAEWRKLVEMVDELISTYEEE